MARTIHNRLTYGDALLARFAQLTLTSTLKADLAAFRSQHVAFQKAAAAVEKAERAYEDAIRVVAELDRRRDTTALALADKMPNAGMGPRTSPFRAFSRYSPTKLVSLSYAAETMELRSMIVKILAAKPPQDVVDLCSKATKENEEVDGALKKLSVPLSALSEARTKRDTVIPDWEKQLRRLENTATVVFRDDPGRADALFSDAAPAQTRVTRKRRAAKAAPADGAAPAGHPPTDLAAPAKRRRTRKR